MILEVLSNFLTKYLPDYEVRSILGLLILTAFLVTVLLDIFKVRKFWIRIVWASLLFIVSILLVILPLFLTNDLLLKLNFNDAFLLHIPIWILFIYQLISLIITLVKKKSMKKIVKNGVKDSKLKNISILRIISYSLFGLLTLSILMVSVFSRPWLMLNNIVENEIVSEIENIYVRLTVPVKKDSIKINISPNQDIDIKYDSVWIFENWIDGFEIIPVESYPADSKIVIYTTGLSNIFPGGDIHEQSLEFFTPSLPDIESSNLESVKGAFTVDTDLEFNLKGLDGNYVYWDFEISPAVEYRLLRNHENKIVLDFDSLSQGTNYDVKIFQANRIYLTETNEEVRLSHLELIKEYSFKTADAPGIENFNWNGVYLANTEPLIIEFTDEIEFENLKKNYKIEPSIEHTLKLDDDNRTLRIIPSSSFKKGTQYKVTFSKGMKSILGGYLEDDMVVEFNTAGTVYPASFYPRNGNVDIKRSLGSVSVTFDQPVDKVSAQSNFSISPSIPGSFSWKGNTMYYSFSNSLEYYTRYTINVASGVKSLYGYDSVKSYSSSFTTEKEVFILSVPQYYQPYGFDCNLYATKMVLAYRGVSISVDGMRNSIGVGQNPNSSWVEGYGVHWGPVSSYIGNFRSNSVKSGWNVLSMLAEVREGNPVILFWYNGYTQPSGVITLDGGYTGYNGMHSEVVVGYTGRVDNPSSIIVNDPWRGRRYLSLGTFNSLWSYLGNIGIVVY